MQSHLLSRPTDDEFVASSHDHLLWLIENDLVEVTPALLSAYGLEGHEDFVAYI
jgi:hypothetical protein